MRVVIDAVPLLIRSAGVKNYLYHWTEHLRLAAPPDTIATFPALGGFGPLRHNGSIAGGWRTGTGLAELALSNYTRLPVLDWLTRGADVFHCSGLTRHPPRRPRLTATIHDMTCWLMPELHPAANLRADRNFESILRRADGLIAVSASTKTDAVRVLGLRPEKIAVIHSGIAAPHPGPLPAAHERQLRGVQPHSGESRDGVDGAARAGVPPAHDATQPRQPDAHS